VVIARAKKLKTCLPQCLFRRETSFGPRDHLLTEVLVLSLSVSACVPERVARFEVGIKVVWHE